MPADISDALVGKFVNEYDSHTYDPTDFSAVDAVLEHKITDVITDDADFHNDSRLTVYTYCDNTKLNSPNT